MKHKFSYLFTGFLLMAAVAFGQTANVTKGSVTNNLTGTLNTGTQTVTANDGGTITYSGTGAINSKTLQTYTPATLPVSTATQTALDAKQRVELLKSASFTAVAGENYAITASATATDPSSPSNGQSYQVRVSAGTLTIGSKTFTMAGTVVTRSYDGGVWSSTADTERGPVNLIFAGDSITADPAGVAAVLPTLSFFKGRTVNVVNTAIAGWTLQNIDADYAAHVAPYEPNTTGIPAWLWFWGGANNIGNSPDGFNTLRESYIDRARAGGFRIITLSVMRRSDADDTTEWTRNGMNNGVSSVLNKIDIFVDAANMCDPRNPAESSDVGAPYVHPSLLWKAEFAKQANAMLEARYPSSPYRRQALGAYASSFKAQEVISSGAGAAGEAWTDYGHETFKTVIPSGDGTFPWWATRVGYNSGADWSIQNSPAAAYGSLAYTDRLLVKSGGGVLVPSSKLTVGTTTEGGSVLNVVSTSTNVASFTGAANGLIDFTNGTYSLRTQLGSEAALGTVEAVDFILRTGNTERIRFGAGGITASVGVFDISSGGITLRNQIGAEGAFGTVGAHDLIFRTNNSERVRIDATTGVVSIPAGVSGNASTATALATARTINGVSFNGTANITIAAAASNLASHYTDTTTTHTDGTEDDLYSDTLTAGILGTNGSTVEETEHVGVVSSATAARRIKKYFGGTLIFDSGSLTLSLGGEFSVETTVIRESSSIVRCTVAVTSTSASTVPYSTYTRITGLTLANTQVLKTTGIASGTGAASGDIINRLSVIKSSVQ